MLRSIYLFERERLASIATEEADLYLRFLASYLLERRQTYLFPVTIELALKAALSRRRDDGRTALMDMLVARDRPQVSGDALQAWFYFEALPRHGLGSMISGEDLGFLGRSPGSASHLTTLDRLLATAGGASRTARPEPAYLRFLRLMTDSARPETPLPTVSVVGFHRSVLGLGEDARSLFECLCAIGVAAELVDVSPPGLDRADEGERHAPFEAPRATGSVIIVCLPAFEMMRVLAASKLAVDRRRQYVVGYWPWETTSLPEDWDHAYDFVDEVWASSRFLHDVYASRTARPVTHVPLHVAVDNPTLGDDLRGLFDGRYTFLGVFDFHSRVDRKNPEGSIAAFRRAFPDRREPVQLILKTLHGDRRPADLDALRRLLGGDRRIAIVDGAVPRADLCGMIAAADAYLSLHRAEGFGRPLAEAMLLGTPVVATGWSGCADFLNEDTGFPVRSTLRPVAPHEYPFAAGSWAEPDGGHAADLMRFVYDHRASAATKAAAAKHAIQRDFGRNAVAAALKRRLLAIGGRLHERGAEA